LVENCRLEPTLHLFGALIGVIPLEFCRDFWHQKTRVPGIVCVILGLAIFAELQLVTDRRTHDDSIYRANTALHGQNHTSRFRHVFCTFLKLGNFNCPYP